MLRLLLFLGVCVAIAIAYGVAHDLITAHVAVEYFTVHHVRIIESESPVAMALLWGVLATWWVGMIAGVVLVGANTLGRLPQLPYRQIAGWVVRWSVFSLTAAMAVLLAIYLLANVVPLQQRQPSFEHDRRLVAVAMAHETSYFLSAVGCFVLACWVVRCRRRSVPSLPDVASGLPQPGSSSDSNRLY